MKYGKFISEQSQKKKIGTKKLGTKLLINIGRINKRKEIK